jgi:DhnA family fructose-bisphosphate aldolase class Ia
MKYRLNRLFNPTSQKCLDVALDHGFFNEPDFLAGIEDIQRAVGVLLDAAPDAIQLTAGQADVLQKIANRAKPALVLRTDVANVYGTKLPKACFSRMIENPVEQAVRLDAVCVVVNLFNIPSAPEVTDQCIQNILRIKPDCDRWNMPLMIEPLVFKTNSQAGGYMVDGDCDKIRSLARQAVELGADLIKADPTEDAREYHKVIEAARVPVLVRGGGRAPDAEILKRTEELIRQGAAGIVYGRNIIQHGNPRAMTKALLAIVHDRKTAKQAAAILAK